MTRRAQTKKPLISVLMPVYNGMETGLPRAIKNILGQTYENVQLLIVDDCSTDHSADLINSFQDERIVYVKRDKRVGRADITELISLADGEFLTSLGHDDFYQPNAFNVILSHFSEDPSLEVVFGRIHPVDERGHIMQMERDHSVIFESPIRNSSEVFPWMFSYFAMSAFAMIRKETLQKKLDDSYTRHGARRFTDYDLCFRLALCAKIKVINKFLLFSTEREGAYHKVDSEELSREAFRVISHYRRVLPIERIYPSILEAECPADLQRVKSDCYLQLARYMMNMPARTHINLDLVESDLERSLEMDASHCARAMAW